MSPGRSGSGKAGHVLFLTQYFPPEMGAPPRRISELARGLADRGWKITVVTAMPNYPTGCVFDGYRGRWLVRERVAPFDIVRTWIYPVRSGRFVGRMANYFSFATSSAVLGVWHPRRVDAIVVESPPLTMGLSAVATSFLKRAPYIFNVSDLWPESAVRMGALNNAKMIAAATWLERSLYRHAAAITGQAPGIVKSIHDRHPDKRVELISNGVDSRVFRPDVGSEAIRKQFGVNDKLGVVYAGLHGLAQGLKQVLDAADKTRARPDIRFVLIGDGPEKKMLVEDARARGLDNVSFFPPEPAGRIPEILASMDVALIPLALHLPGAVPSKIYEAMACGLPIVFAASGDGVAILEEAGAGLVVGPGDGNGIAASVTKLADNPALRKEMSERGRDAARTRFDRRAIAEKMHRLLLDVAAGECR